MKKILSFLLSAVLLVSTMSMGSFGVSANAVCTKHTYTNACDTSCNNCGKTRKYVSHNYDDCFASYEDNIEYYEGLQKTPNQTGVFSAEPLFEQENFTQHYILITDKNGAEVKYNEKSKGWPMVKGQKYTIWLKSQFDTVDIDFKLTKTADKIFPDTNVNEWYSNAVVYTVGAGVINGYSNGKFGTSDKIQRQDFLLMLARFDGVDLSKYEGGKSGLSDVKDGAYYESAVNWGVEKGIVKGYNNGKFGIRDKLTREQLITFLYRYAEYKGLDMTTQLDTEHHISTVYTDYKKVSSFAKQAVIWAIENEIVNGKKGRIDPQGKAQRCEVAQIIYNNFLSNTIPGVQICIHKYKDATCTAPETCKLCGATRGTALGHKYKAATCTAPKTCGTCGKTAGKAKGHSFIGATCLAPEICKSCGATRGEALGHSYKDATCTAPETCKICGETRGSTLEHSYDAATCVLPERCKKCGATRGEALGHSYKDATCTVPQTCETCGGTNGAPLDHAYKDATCTVPQTCETCGGVNGVPLGHSYNDATCTAPKTCGACGKTEGNELGHNYVTGECTRVNNGKVCGDYSASYCPKLYFTGDMSQITNPSQTNKKIECDINFEYRSRQQIRTGAAKIKIQGTSSAKYVKKNYTINFYKDSNYSEKLGVDVGWGAQSKYCLKANWIDKTHSRNVVTAKLVGEMQEKYSLFEDAPNGGAIDGFPVEVYINGQFHGLYTMNIPKDAWQFGMDKDNPNHIVICGENWEPQGAAATHFKTLPTTSDFDNYWSIEAGPETTETKQKACRLFEFITNSTDEEFKQNFNQYLDLDATINYYIMMTYGWMPDNAGKNMLLATYDGNVWYPSLYDLDTTWGTHWDGGSTYNYSSGFTNGGGSLLWKKLETNYPKEIAARYFELRQDVLDPEHVMDSFESFYNSIPREVLARETAKWNTADHPIPGYDFTQIQDYLDTVVPRLDERYATWR